MAFVIFVDGTIEGVKPENGTTFNYRELQKLVGGLIEVVPQGAPHLVFLCDKEGLLKDKLRNYKVSELLDCPVVGDILVLGKDEWDPDLLGSSDQAADNKKETP